MAQYATGEHVILPGVYQVVYNSASSGTGKIEISKDDGATYQDMIDGSFTSSEDRVAYLGGAKYKITLTGDAVMHIDPIQAV